MTKEDWDKVFSQVYQPPFKGWPANNWRTTKEQQEIITGLAIWLQDECGYRRAIECLQWLEDHNKCPFAHEDGTEWWWYIHDDIESFWKNHVPGEFISFRHNPVDELLKMHHAFTIPLLSPRAAYTFLMTEWGIKEGYWKPLKDY